MNHEKKHKHLTEDPSCCKHPSAEASPKSWYRRPLFWVSCLTVLLYLASFLFSFLVAYRHAFVNYLRMIGWPMTFGFLLGGLMDHFIPKEYITKLLAHRRKRSILYATGLGFLMSACSHGILALSMELHKKGASGSAVLSFLLASPWANLPITFLLVGFFGWKGLLIIFSALFVAISTGLIFQFLDHKGWIEPNPHAARLASDFSIRRDIASRWRGYHFSLRRVGEDVRGIAVGILALADMVLWWVVLGMILASLAGAFIPAHVFNHFFGPNLLGLAMTLLAAALMEVCSEGTSPLAFEIYKHTGALGNAFAFLMGGVVTDYTEVGLVWTNLGRRTALWMLAVTIPQVFLLGWLFNHIF